jgi:hypothetical protein
MLKEVNIPNIAMVVFKIPNSPNASRPISRMIRIVPIKEVPFENRFKIEFQKDPEASRMNTVELVRGNRTLLREGCRSENWSKILKKSTN